jgi:hypothetical protein
VGLCRLALVHRCEFGYRSVVAGWLTVGMKPLAS